MIPPVRLVVPVAAIAAPLAVPLGAQADDLVRPVFRHTPGSTVQHWDFSAGAAGGTPDAPPYSNPYGMPVLVPGAGTSWRQAEPERRERDGTITAARRGVWMVDAGTSLEFRVPSDRARPTGRFVQVQVTYIGSVPEVIVGGLERGEACPGTLIAFSERALEDGWTHGVWEFSVPGCPGGQLVTVLVPATAAGSVLDQVVIDTFIVPEGAAGGLLLAAMAAGRRRRR